MEDMKANRACLAQRLWNNTYCVFLMDDASGIPLGAFVWQSVTAKCPLTVEETKSNLNNFCYFVFVFEDDDSVYVNTKQYKHHTNTFLIMYTTPHTQNQK